MGGAERTARKRRQQQQAAGKQAVAKARGGIDSKRIGIIVGVVVLIAAVVVGGLIWTNSSQNATEGQTIPTSQVPASQYPEQRDGLVAVTGNPDAPVTIDVYADFLCPVCGRFQQEFGKQINEKVAQGELLLRTHMVPLLVDASTPAGYSLDAANASLLAADAGKFTAFHDSLFAHQPEEGKRGYSKEQLIQLGRDLGITDQAFAAGINNGKFDQQLTAEMQRISEDSSLHQDFGGRSGFGTPTVTHDGKIVDFAADPQWLDKLTANAGS
ncbi:DsbA family protein [Prauserella cavernicola]|uniref:Thioredoxin domain-containing protein n=1 Tax=Prauserella cavernicola TaxID=2800127 RepID=A0A934R1N8_9PSEU|nr:thioredoxin domain-containing protein [Prauserella cavernicola]MBK1789239.1 thioredoxin domain-containing protein [Prauserella cavernicola]